MLDIYKISLEICGSSDSDRRFVLSVLDSGIGIPLDAQATIFDDFTQVDW
ncbi:MAG: signal transduction histidine kinase [Gammaproteobacteria bacterium]|jgi:signal transduction histidine kinase